LESSVLSKINKGDQEAFRQFFENYYQALSAYANSFLNDTTLAQDISQEVFIKFWEKRSLFENEISAKSYLYTAVKNTCLNHFKHLKVVQTYEQRAVQSNNFVSNPDHSAIEQDTFNILYQSILSLPKSAQKIMLLALHGLKNPEIAEKLQISVNTVKTQKKIAYAKLKDQLQPHFFSFLLAL
jgi:RNA polymerase sigma-70 factor (ECF subfamily)